MAQLRDVNEVKKKLSKKAAAVARVLATPDGQTLLAAVEEEFCSGKTGLSLIGPDPQHTAYRVGAYDVVLYLKQLQQYNQRGATDVDPLA